MAELFAPQPPTLEQMVASVERWLIMNEPVEVTIGPQEVRSIVDREDLIFLAEHNWQLQINGYIRRSMKRREVIDGRKSYVFHRLIMNAPAGAVVDHINGIKTDNRKANLRIATASQNARNSVSIGRTSRFKGVSRQGNRWLSCIKAGDYVKHTSHSSEIEAAHKYDELARMLHGEFARLNFPDVLDVADHHYACMEGVLAILRERTA